MKTIVWDIDDVLNNFTREWLESCWLPAHPGSRLTYDDLTENPPHQLLGIGRNDYLQSLDQFRLSPRAKAMVPDRYLIDWFRKNGLQYRHIALTARPRKTVNPAFEWVIRHFGEWFQTLSFIPTDRPGEPLAHPDRDKSDFLLWLGKADYFIDDSPGNIAAAKKLNMKAFLVSHPWSREGQALKDILEAGLEP